jgi:hypothetical protein
MTIAAALALGAAAFAADASPFVYSGRFQPSGSLRFAVTHRNGHRWVTRFTFSQFPLASCDHGANTETSSLSYAIPVRDGSFHTIGIIGRHKHPRSELVLRGSFGAHGRATGKMRIFGSAVPVDDASKGPHDRCDSDVVDWRARRRR